jgi:hypothetical protein
MNRSILITAYYPPITYFSAILNSEEIIIEMQENYNRQTIRNRCYILSANCVQMLSVPIVKTNNKKITQIEIDYNIPWQNKHAHAIKSAYGKSPFFQYYYEELIKPIFKKHRLLIELNNDILKTCLNILNISTKINYTTTYIKNYVNNNDYRKIFNKKYPPFLVKNYPIKPYIQTFNDRFDFILDLSIIDLIFNTGYEALLYLKN